MATTKKASAAETKTAVVEPVTKKATEVKAEAKTEVKAADKKDTTKKAVAKKPATTKTTTTTKKETAIDVVTYVQFSGKEVVVSDILETIKKVWVDKFQGKLEEIKTIETYIKPEEHRAYFVVNGLSNGDYFIEL
jgi:hypothetical protein